MESIFGYLLKHIEIDIIALLLALIGAVVWLFRRNKTHSDVETKSRQINVEKSKDVAINNSAIIKPTVFIGKESKPSTNKSRKSNRRS